ncbi:hypothetical protein ACTZPN_26260, partial [Klebsiella pneumoniae]
MDNGSGETVQDAQRGQNRQAEPGGEYFVYFWTGRGGTETLSPFHPFYAFCFFLFFHTPTGPFQK